MTKQQINHIRDYLISEGFTDESLIEDLLDHMVTECEILKDNLGLSFTNAFEQAKMKLMPIEPYELEKDLKLLTTQKHNIMIKKTAYIGGYLSALCLCIALLFGALSIQDNVRSDRQQESFEAQINVETRLNKIEKEERRALYEKYYLEAADLKVSSLKNLEKSQMLLMAAIVLFCITYLPYRFYNSYQKSELEFS